MLTIDPAAQFPVVGDWRSVTLEQFEHARDSEAFVIEAYLPEGDGVEAETAWAWRNPGGGAVEFEETDCIEQNDMTGMRGPSTLVFVNRKPAYRYQTRIVFRYYLKA